MKNILLIIFLSLLKGEEVIVTCIHKSKNIEFELNNDYIKIPKSKPIDYSKYQKSVVIKEKKSIISQSVLAEDISSLPLAKTFPIEEHSIIKKIAKIIGLELKTENNLVTPRLGKSDEKKGANKKSKKSPP